MQAQSVNTENSRRGAGSEAVETQRSGVSRDAIFAGVAAAAALSLVLCILGRGLGMASISPWSSGTNHSAAATGISTILWISFTELAASAVGGYMAGRLRSRWASIHSDEVYFGDRARLAGLGGCNFADRHAGRRCGARRQGRPDSGASPVDYFSDMLLRSKKPATDAGGANVRAEVMRIFANGA